MRLGLKLFLGYLLVVGLALYFSFSIFNQELKPAFRKSTEETLIDTANILAVLVRDDVLDGSIADGRFQARLAEYTGRVPNAKVWGVVKDKLDHRIYITDRKGIVVFDSAGIALGQDYSRWNDVYRTLNGQYGARASRSDAADERTSVMYVAAPILDGNRIIGVLSVGKPATGMQPFIDRAARKVQLAAALLLLVALAIGLAFSWSLARAIRQVADYARAAAEGRRTPAPSRGGPEIVELAHAVERMREQLEGRDYVEHYVHALTHEIKSPLTAINGAAELLQQDLTPAQQTRFAAIVSAEAARIQHLVDRLLAQAAVEHQQGLTERRAVFLQDLVAACLEARAPLISQNGLRIENRLSAPGAWLGERFLLAQAVGNLLDNAIDFTPAGGAITIRAERLDHARVLSVVNTGSAIPEYARERVFERFFSLPRPHTGAKSTGLGLAFVKEVAQLHAGTIALHNITAADGSVVGVEARLMLPAAAEGQRP
jgi:two-component system sensor histidine kinase CreC